MNKKIVDRKMEGFLFSLCWLVYFTSYIGRLNYSSVMSSIIDENILTFSQAGVISMAYFLAYGAGQFCNGILGDRIRPQLMIFIGLFLSGAANFCMGLIDSFPVMTVLWGINGYMQSMIWPPIIRIFAEKYTEDRKKKCCVDIVSSMAMGTLISYFLSACALRLFSWQSAFFLAAGIMIVVAVCWSIGFKKVELFVTEHGVEQEASIRSTANANTKHEKGKRDSGAFWSMIVGSGLLVVLLPVMIHGILKDGVTQWVPTYIYESFNVTASFSAILTMILPLINLTGAYMAKFVDQKNPKQEVKSAVCFFGAAVTSLICLLLFGNQNVILTAILFSVITSSMMAVNTLFVNLIPLYFEAQGRVATVSGFLNATAYIGSAISTFAIGVMVEKVGWSFTILSWVILTTAGTLICVRYAGKRIGIGRQGLQSSGDKCK